MKKTTHAQTHTRVSNKRYKELEALRAECLIAENRIVFMIIVIIFFSVLAAAAAAVHFVYIECVCVCVWRVHV